ncbi:MAG: hypothetical protein GC138_04835 [Gammaproteobacteria bacterium]|nr:hypothetical protein [Gammaproteobacteria bacterium]
MSASPTPGGPQPRAPSIRRRLFWLLLPVTIVVWVVTALNVYRDTRNEIRELTNAQLAETARALLNLVSHEYYEEQNFRHKAENEQVLPDTQEVPQRLAATLHQYEQSLIFQMWVDGDELVLRSEQAPDVRLSKLEKGFSDEIFGGHNWRVFSVSDPEHKMLVQVAERQSQLTELELYVSRRILFPIFIAIPFLAWVIWFGVGRAMRPLNRLADEVGSQDVGRLERIAAHRVPVEAKPLIDALNALFDRLQRAFENERRFTADAAHELRTPLAALKTYAQVALREPNHEKSQRALGKVIQGVDRATHLVQQLLTLARIDPTRWEPQKEPIDLAELASERLAAMSGQAIEKEIEISLSSGGREDVKGDRAMLDILITNLLGNAIKYTPMHGAIEVGVQGSDHEVVLSISDSGEGIPEQDRSQVFERFYRRERERGSTPGCGLGLSIVHRIVEIMGAEIRLDESHLGGLLVEVRIPRCESAPSPAKGGRA